MAPYLNYLIVGSNGVASRAIVKALEEHHQEQGSPYHITACASRRRPKDFAHTCLENIDLGREGAVPAIVEAIQGGGRERRGGKGGAIDTLFFTPARGAVGLPIRRASEVQIEESVNFSLRPFCQLIERLRPRISVALSGYIWLETIAMCYGAMFYPKVALELLAEAYPQSIRVVRLGYFPSHSSRAIYILTRRALENEAWPEEFGPAKERWLASNRRFNDHFAELTFSLEKKAYSSSFSTPYRPTQPEDITAGIKRLLGRRDSSPRNPTGGPAGGPATGSIIKPIINIIGNWYWEEEQAYRDWPKDIFSKAEAIYREAARELKG